DRETPTEQQYVLGEDDGKHVRATVTDGAEQGQIAASLEHVPQEDSGQPDSADQKTQTTECLERGNVRVFDTMECGEPIDRRDRVGAEILTTVFHGRRNRTHAVVR